MRSRSAPAQKARAHPSGQATLVTRLRRYAEPLAAPRKTRAAQALRFTPGPGSSGGLAERCHPDGFEHFQPRSATALATQRPMIQHVSYHWH